MMCARCPRAEHAAMATSLVDSRQALLHDAQTTYEGSYSVKTSLISFQPQADCPASPSNRVFVQKWQDWAPYKKMQIASLMCPTARATACADACVGEAPQLRWLVYAVVKQYEPSRVALDHARERSCASRGASIYPKI